jgi:cell division protein FtsW (lipid II flippase)
VLGFFMLIPPVVWLARPRASGTAVACLASVVLLLSQVRTAWLGLAISAILAVLSLEPASRVRVIVLCVLGGLCATPFMRSPEVSDVTMTRIDTLGRPADDMSAASRMEGHLAAFEFAGTHPFGAGIGVSVPRIEQAIGMRDSVIVTTLVQFGLIGACLYGLALILLCARLCRYYRSVACPEAVGLACAGVGLICTAGLGTVTAGPQGVVFWLIGGLALASWAPRDDAVPSPRLPQMRPDGSYVNAGV